MKVLRTFSAFYLSCLGFASAKAEVIPLIPEVCVPYAVEQGLLVRSSQGQDPLDAPTAKAYWYFNTEQEGKKEKTRYFRWEKIWALAKASYGDLAHEIKRSPSSDLREYLDRCDKSEGVTCHDFFRPRHRAHLEWYCAPQILQGAMVKDKAFLEKTIGQCLEPHKHFGDKNGNYEKDPYYIRLCAGGRAPTPADQITDHIRYEKAQLFCEGMPDGTAPRTCLKKKISAIQELHGAHKREFSEQAKASGFPKGYFFTLAKLDEEMQGYKLFDTLKRAYVMSRDYNGSVKETPYVRSEQEQAVAEMLQQTYQVVRTFQKVYAERLVMNDLPNQTVYYAGGGAVTQSEIENVKKNRRRYDGIMLKELPPTQEALVLADILGWRIRKEAKSYVTSLKNSYVETAKWAEKQLCTHPKNKAMAICGEPKREVRRQGYQRFYKQLQVCTFADSKKPPELVEAQIFELIESDPKCRLVLDNTESYRKRLYDQTYLSRLEEEIEVVNKMADCKNKDELKKIMRPIKNENLLDIRAEVEEMISACDQKKPVNPNTIKRAAENIFQKNRKNAVLLGSQRFVKDVLNDYKDDAEFKWRIRKTRAVFGRWYEELDPMYQMPTGYYHMISPVLYYDEADWKKRPSYNLYSTRKPVFMSEIEARYEDPFFEELKAQENAAKMNSSSTEAMRYLEESSHSRLYAMTLIVWKYSGENSPVDNLGIYLNYFLFNRQDAHQRWLQRRTMLATLGLGILSAIFTRGGSIPSVIEGLVVNAAAATAAVVLTNIEKKELEYRLKMEHLKYMLNAKSAQSLRASYGEIAPMISQAKFFRVLDVMFGALDVGILASKLIKLQEQLKLQRVLSLGRGDASAYRSGQMERYRLKFNDERLTHPTFIKHITSNEFSDEAFFTLERFLAKRKTLDEFLESNQLPFGRLEKLREVVEGIVKPKTVSAWILKTLDKIFNLVDATVGKFFKLLKVQWIKFAEFMGKKIPHGRGQLFRARWFLSQDTLAGTLEEKRILARIMTELMNESEDGKAVMSLAEAQKHVDYLNRYGDQRLKYGLETSTENGATRHIVTVSDQPLRDAEAKIIEGLKNLPEQDIDALGKTIYPRDEAVRYVKYQFGNLTDRQLEKLAEVIESLNLASDGDFKILQRTLADLLQNSRVRTLNPRYGFRANALMDIATQYFENEEAFKYVFELEKKMRSVEFNQLQHARRALDSNTSLSELRNFEKNLQPKFDLDAYINDAGEIPAPLTRAKLKGIADDRAQDAVSARAYYREKIREPGATANEAEDYARKMGRVRRSIRERCSLPTVIMETNLLKFSGISLKASFLGKYLGYVIYQNTFENSGKANRSEQDMKFLIDLAVYFAIKKLKVSSNNPYMGLYAIELSQYASTFLGRGVDYLLYKYFDAHYFNSEAAHIADLQGYMNEQTLVGMNSDLEKLARVMEDRYPDFPELLEQFMEDIKKESEGMKMNDSEAFLYAQEKLQGTELEIQAAEALALYMRERQNRHPERWPFMDGEDDAVDRFRFNAGVWDPIETTVGVGMNGFAMYLFCRNRFQPAQANAYAWGVLLTYKIISYAIERGWRDSRMHPDAAPNQGPMPQKKE